MGIGFTELLLILLLAVVFLFDLSHLRPFLGGLAYAYKYPGLRVKTRFAPPSLRTTWIAIGLLVVLVTVAILSA